MNSNEISRRQLAAWVFAAAAAPLAQLLGGRGWPEALLTGAVCGVLCAAVLLLPQDWRQKRWLCAVQALWAVAALAGAATMSARAWPDAGNGIAVPLVLLALGLWSVWDGAAAAGRAAATVFWLLALLLAAVFVAGGKDIRPENLQLQWQEPDGGIVFALMLPAVGACLPGKRHAGAAWVPAVTGLFGVAVATLCAGVLSPQLAIQLENPFYEMSRSLNLLGVAQRFEALVSAAMTLGWFCLISLLLSAVYHLAGQVHPGWERPAVAVAAIAAIGLILGGVAVPGIWLGMLAAVCWGLLPLFTQGIVQIKKLRKNEKRG